MSSLIVEVCKIDDIYPHKNAEKLDIAKIKGWEVCIGKGQFKVNDKVIYFPVDSVLPQELSDKLNITKYLTKGRVRAASLRGLTSYGTIMPCELDLPIGTDVAEMFGITKFEQKIKCTDGDTEKQNLSFHTYFSMENLRNYPDAFLDGEEVYVSEKIHGQNARVGLIQVANDNGEKVWSWAAGSHDVQRKQYITKTDGIQVESVFWKALTPEVKELLVILSDCEYKAEEIDNCPLVKSDEGVNILLFAERYGSGCQDLGYGMSNGNFGFRYFDITYNGKYLDCVDKYHYFNKFNIETVPILYNGPFSMVKMLELSVGNTTLGDNHVREGIVIVSALEKPYICDKKVMNRKQFKLINPDYLTRKNGTEFH